jgi:phosphoglycolate phosphatase-like HAD superfamily hydrolase
VLKIGPVSYKCCSEVTPVLRHRTIVLFLAVAIVWRKERTARLTLTMTEAEIQGSGVMRRLYLLQLTFTLLLLAMFAAGARAVAQTDPLPSWNDGPARQAIVDFVQKTTDKANPDYVPPAERIVTFDNDGTLWTEHPMYTQLAFALDRVKALAPQHPEWKTKQPFKAVLDNDLKTLAASGEKGLVELVMASHAGMSTAEFGQIVTDWFKTARDPRFKRPYTELAYQPMLELLAYLRANDFKTYIVSGGGIEFMRPMTEAVYGIPPEQVIGSSIKTKYEYDDGKPVLIRLPEINFIDDKAGKPVGINMFIGRRPVAAAGNSDGDRQMLEWTGAGAGARLMMLVFHDDAKREYAYGPANGLPDTKFGTFSPSLMEEARKNGWVVISMKDDWKRIFAFEP